MLANKVLKIMVKQNKHITPAENSRLANIMILIEEMKQDGGFTSDWLRELFHGWLESECCDNSDGRTRSNYFSYILDLSKLFDCINGGDM